jgi:branched-chain amino acid transport system substrate-binding protein
MNRFSTLAITAFVAIALAACDKGSSQSSSSGASTSTASGTSTAAAATGTPIKIGLLEALTGPIASVGKDNRDGFQTYFSSHGNQVAGHPIQIIVADTTGQPDVALAKAQDLVENQHVDILAGINQTPECYAVAQYVQKVQVPLLVSGNCGATYLTVDPKYASPNLIRASSNSGAQAIIGDYLASKGYKKAIMFTADYAGAAELNDLVAGSFVKHGGSVIQELHPPLQTTDFAPYLTQLKKDADVIIAFEPGADGLRFGQQYADYATAGSKTQVVDILGQIAGGTNLPQLKDAAVGFIGAGTYSDGINSQAAQDFKKAMNEAFPGRPLSGDEAVGYAGGQIIAAALQKVNGNVQDKQALLSALYATNVDTPRGPVTFDQFHDIVSSVYIYQIVKNGNDYSQKLLQTIPNAGQLSDYTVDELKAGKFGQLKGKWVGMTRDDVGKALTGGQ